MANKMLVDATHPEETRVVVVRGNKVEEFDFESATKTQLRGNIYLARVTRVEPSLQAAFVDYGGNRHGFLAFSEIHPDYYQIPVADREALLAEELEEYSNRAASENNDEDDDELKDGASDSADVGDEDASSDDKDGTAEAEPVKPRRRRASPKKAASDTDEKPKRRRRKKAEPKEAEADVAQDASGNESADNAEATASSTETADDQTSDIAPTSSENADQFEAQSNDAEIEVASEEALTATDDETPPSNMAMAAPRDPSVSYDENDAAAEGEETSEPVAEADAKTEAADQDDVSGDQGVEETDQAAALEAQDDALAESVEAPVKRKRTRNRRVEQDDDSDDDNSGDGDGDGDGDVESVGAEDAMEEVPERARKSRRQYKIHEVIKRRQILLVQVVKEERGNKGAALTTYLSLAGRYSVLMPNTGRGGGISRKVTNPSDRKHLRQVASDLDVPQGMGVILRTAGASRTKAEINRDFEYLLRLWESVRDLTLKSSAPCLVYEEGNLIKRSIRDLYGRDLDEVLISGDTTYSEARDFMGMLMPSHVKNIKRYKDKVPIFTRHNVEGQLDSMFQPQVTLRSGGYIVINQTEALVAVDVNSGRATKERSIEDTAVQTNLEASEEVARQLRLRDLAGLVVVDFIDMEEKRNNRAVERRLKECLKSDRARIQVGRISHFGLLEMSRQRLRTGVLEGSSHTCPHCNGTGIIRMTSSVALHLLRALEAALVRNARHDQIVRTTADVALYLLNSKREHVSAMEDRFGVAIDIRIDASLETDPYLIDRGMVATRTPKEDTSFVQVDSVLPFDEEAEETQEQEPEPQSRRRRRKRSDNNNEEDESEKTAEHNGDETNIDGDDASEGGRKRRRRGRRGGRRNRRDDETEVNASEVEAPSEQEGEATADETVDEATADETAVEAKAEISEPGADTQNAADGALQDRQNSQETSASQVLEEAATSKANGVASEAVSDEKAAATKEVADQANDEPAAEVHKAAKTEPEPEDPDKLKKSGWWQRRSFF